MIWIVGSHGMLGTELTHMCERENIQFHASDIEVDITDMHAIESFAENKSIEWIVNCAAYTAVDKAEDEPERAAELNVIGPQNLGMFAEKAGAKLIHLSTDYVFGNVGSKFNEKRPLKESDSPSPESLYGRTKLDGEKALQEHCSRVYIIRIAWLYGRWGKNFVYTMLRLLGERDTLRVVNDQSGCPTWSRNVAALILNIVNQDNGQYDVYHYCGKGTVSWYKFAQHIAEYAIERKMLQTSAELLPCSSKEFTTKAKRPKWSVLSTDKTSSTFCVEAERWQLSLKKFFDDIATEWRK